MQRVISTYRIQLNPDFDFDAAAKVAPYIRSLGVSHVYASPYLQAAPGSTHGYDVVDHSQVNEELGGEKAHEWFCRALGKNGLGQVLDIVPNHMAISGPENRWWWDVLENGPSSRYAVYFDVDWQYSEIENRVLLPILGDHYGRVIEAREIRVERHAGSFTVRYYDNTFPVDPRSMKPVFERAADHADSADLAFIAGSLDHLPPPTSTDRKSRRRRHRDKEVLRAQLDRLLEEQPAVRRALDEELERLNNDADRLAELLDRQNYRLAFWRIARSDLAYRRFFDINDLVGLRMEDDEVFDDTHALITRWLHEGVIDGLRIDHPDGLRDPEEYFRRLHDSAPNAWVVGEKILHPDEQLRQDWPVAGTTGYDFLNAALGLCIDQRNESAFDTLFREISGEQRSYHEILTEKKYLVIRELLGSDVNRLVSLLTDICGRHRRYRDYSREELHQTLVDLIVAFPVYRSYVRPDAGTVTEEDAQLLRSVVAQAQTTREDSDEELFTFLLRIMLLEVDGEQEREFVARLQQITGPVMAKAAEDTAFYCYTRFTALNEVGGEPDRFGLAPHSFHELMRERAHTWPGAMLASSTHDTKRSEDVRSRLAVLSELPERWESFVRKMQEACAGFRRPASTAPTEDGTQYPDGATEYLMYQTVVGAWPIELERLQPYLEKAVREAKLYSSWTNIDPEYEAAVFEFAESMLGSDTCRSLIQELVEEIREAGWLNSLALTLLKLACPGVPDIYQGNELWDLSLVDPDNRRAVDYELRSELLARVSPDDETDLGEALAAVAADTEHGLAKLWVTRQALHLRRRRPVLFLEGEYQALDVSGEKAAHAVAFSRGGKVVALLPRLPYTLGGDWADTTVHLPEGRWFNVLSGEVVSGGAVALKELCANFPVALLEKAPGAD
ncbi:MAG: malto-oligosyltrehalose synthase [Spirochaetaceae bacterium]|nr:MAG: malto-oligosyltrehalose synthase [Spirochaetaceae bacterium]